MSAKRLELKYRNIIEWFLKNMPVAESELNYQNPYQLLVAVILSAQCTDKRVNLTTPALFAKYPTPESLSQATTEEVYELIKSISYPNNKAKHLVEMAKKLVNEFNSIVPDDIDQLQKLPGVGRKTANVIASVIYDRPVIAVDTHVFRVARRIGLSSGKSPLEVEKDLTNNIPQEYRAIAHHWLILHGRYVCTAKKEKCDSCGIAPHCDYFKSI
ncbi:MAG: endonuclease III [Bacteroidales bacterium]|nr:endonuclease III [Bacteroidales bacterium]